MMGAPYIPIFLDWTDTTVELSDQEKGRLVDALVLYAKGEDWQDRIKGNERYVFPAFRKMIDRSAEISAKRRVAGASGGNQFTANYSKLKQTRANAAEEENEEEKEGEKEYSFTPSKSFSKSYDEWRRKKNAESV